MRWHIKNIVKRAIKNTNPDSNVKKINAKEISKSMISEMNTVIAEGRITKKNERRSIIGWALFGIATLSGILFMGFGISLHLMQYEIQQVTKALLDLLLLPTMSIMGWHIKRNFQIWKILDSVEEKPADKNIKQPSIIKKVGRVVFCVPMAYVMAWQNKKRKEMINNVSVKNPRLQAWVLHLMQSN